MIVTYASTFFALVSITYPYAEVHFILFFWQKQYPALQSLEKVQQINFNRLAGAINSVAKTSSYEPAAFMY